MRRRQLVTLITAAAVVVLGATGTFVVLRLNADSPDDVVRAYLEAARRGDVAGALDAAGVAAPDTGFATLVTGTTKHDPAWDVAAVEKPITESGDDAEVKATITDRVNSGSGYFRLTKNGRRWTITNPYVRMSAATSPVRVTVIDGRQVTLPGPQEVLPGIYRQTGPTPATVSNANDAHLVVMPGPDEDDERTVVLTQVFAPTAAAQQQFQQRSDAYLDKCATDAACRPAVLQSYFHGADGKIYLSDDVKSGTWHVVRHPAVDLPGSVVAASDDRNRQAFSGQVTVPGVLRFDGVTAAGSFSSTCTYDGLYYGLQAWIDADGTMRTAWSGTAKGPQVDCAG